MVRMRDLQNKKGLWEWYIGGVKTEYRGEPVELLGGETITKTYSNGKDLLMFTNKRLVARVTDIGDVGVEEEFTIPYKTINMWQTSRNRETGNVEGLSIWTNTGEMRLLFLKKEVVREFERILMRECL